MDNSILRRLANSYSAFDGQVIFWMLPFSNHAVTARNLQFDLIEPHFRYTHKETGEVMTEEPREHRALIDALGDDPTPEDIADAIHASPWKVTNLWSAAHNNFVELDPLTIDVEFHLREDAETALHAFALFWSEAPQTLEDRWQQWQLLIGGHINGAWVEAYKATREQRHRAPQKATEEDATNGGEPDPLSSPPSSDGNATDDATASPSGAPPTPASNRRGGAIRS